MFSTIQQAVAVVESQIGKLYVFDFMAKTVTILCSTNSVDCNLQAVAQ